MKMRLMMKVGKEILEMSAIIQFQKLISRLLSKMPKIRLHKNYHFSYERFLSLRVEHKLQVDGNKIRKIRTKRDEATG
jgi:hypothetical protein